LLRKRVVVAKKEIAVATIVVPMAVASKRLMKTQVKMKNN